jgi:hypothetical protein
MTIPLQAPKASRTAPEKRLALYGIAAGAALAGGAAPADANTITLDLTTLPLTSRTTPVDGSLYFDVNASSAAAAVSTSPFAGADFHVFNTHNGAKTLAGASNNGMGINGIASTNGIKAARFSASNFVGPQNNFASHLVKLGSRNPITNFGNFAPGDTGSIGLRFTIGSATHYGWATLTLNSNLTVALDVLGYETTPDTASHVEAANRPSVPDRGSSLALLALGAAGLLALRRQQASA